MIRNTMFFLTATFSLCATLPAQTTDSVQSKDDATSLPVEEIRIKLSDLDAPTTGGFIKAYAIDNFSQLTAGTLADAYLDDIVIENDKFRAVIARPGKPEMGIVRSGTLIDITRADAPIDYFNGLNTTVNPATTGSLAIYTNSEIGSVENSTTVSVSLSGYIGDPGAGAPAPNEKIAVETVYTAAKGSSMLRLDTTFTNETTSSVWLRPADLVDWGEAGVFAEGAGYGGTTAPVNFAIGAIDNFSLGYFTSGTKRMEGFHDGRDSVVLAAGGMKDLANYLQARKAISDDTGDREPPKEFRGTGASLKPGPGLVMFPGTESRYTMGAGGRPIVEPIYVPQVNLRHIDGKATVTLLNKGKEQLFVPPADQQSASFVQLEPKQKYSFTRYLVISNDNWGPIAHTVYAHKGIPTGILTGATVEGVTGNRVPDAVVRIGGGKGWDGVGAAPAMLQVASRADGTYVAYLPEGKYKATAVATGRRVLGYEAPVDIRPDEQPNILIHQLTRESVLRLAISEEETETSSPLPVKVTIISKPPFPTENYGFTPDVSRGIRNTYYLPQGAAAFPLTPGRYRLIISRGIEYDIMQKDITIGPGQHLTVTGTLPHVMKDKLQGMVSMDAGLVTDASAVGYANAESRAIQAACEGVSVIVSGDYDQVTNLQTAIRNQGLERWVKAFHGRRTLLHKDNLTADLFVYPLDEKTSASFDEALSQVRDLPPDVALADLKQQFPNLIFEISRPTHPEYGYLTPFPFNEKEKEFVGNNMPPPDFDAIQILDGKKLGLEPVTYPRYMALQLARLGEQDVFEAPPLSPTGSSFSRLPYGQEVGYPRTYLYLDRDKALSEVTADDIVRAIKGQHYLVTNGPILFFDALNYETRRFDVHPGEIVDLSTTEVVRIRARVLAAPWVTLQGINTRENGIRGITVFNIKPSEMIERYPISGGSGSNVYTRYLDDDAVLDAYAYSTLRSLAPVVPDALPDFGGEYFPYCFSGPIFVDRDGDGKIIINDKEP